MKTKSQKQLAALTAAACLTTVSAQGALVLTDHVQGASFDTFYNSLTDVATGNAPLDPATSGQNRYGLDAAVGNTPADDETQTFTLGSAIVLDSIYVAYNDQRSTGTFNLNIDVNNDDVDDHTFLVTVTNALQSGADHGNDGPIHFLQFDLSSENIALGAGVHNFSLVGVTDNGEGAFLIAPIFNTDQYTDGVLFRSPPNDGNVSGDLLFAVTGVPEPSSLALLGLGGLMLARRRRG